MCACIHSAAVSGRLVSGPQELSQHGGDAIERGLVLLALRLTVYSERQSYRSKPGISMEIQMSATVTVNQGRCEWGWL